MKNSLYLTDEKATLNFGAQMAKLLPPIFTIYLHGQLGAGKTTLVRGLLQSMGHNGKVKSPTYTLVEPYHLADKLIYHFDLYRLADPEELEFIGAKDYFDAGICLVEWPERGKGFMPQPDLVCLMEVENKGRRIELQALSERGQQMLKLLF